MSINKIFIEQEVVPEVKPYEGQLWVTENSNVLMIVRVSSPVDDFESYFWGTVNLSNGYISYLSECYDWIDPLVEHLKEDNCTPLTTSVTITPNE